VLKLNDVTFGLFPYGPANGERGMYIDIGEGEEEISLYEQLKIKLKEKKLEKEWRTAIDSTHLTLLAFKGGAIENPDHFQEWEDFKTDFSLESVEIAKTLKIGEWRAPYCLWIGTPTQFTGPRLFYEQFNSLCGIITDKSYNQLATQEIINHKFTSIIVISDDYKKLIKSLKEKYILKRKLYVVDNKNDDNLKKYCLDNGIRYHYNNYGELFLKLI